MTDWDVQWQERITKVVRRVAKDLIANDETEIGEVVRRRLFEDFRSERQRKQVIGAYAEWCFQRRAQLPPEWTAVDTATTEFRSVEFLRGRFESCYPFHPATLSVFQRKWQALPQYQQTRGTLAMLAQWVSIAYNVEHLQARREPLITLGSAPLDVPEFRSVVLGQLGEPRLAAALEADVASRLSHARALDADTKNALRDIHRRVGSAIFFESTGGQAEKLAHLPELRFALGGPDVDTTSIDNAALTLEARSFFVQKVGADGFKIHHQATLKKVVNDRRASLDVESGVRPAMRSLVRKEFEQGAPLPIELFPEDGTAVPNSPRLTLVVMGPEVEWTGGDPVRRQVAAWTRRRGESDRLCPGALLWCLKKPGRDLREKVEWWLAWKRVLKDHDDGILGSDHAPTTRPELVRKVKDAEEEAQDEVWAGYRFVVLADNQEPDGIRVIDLGAGHSSNKETLAGRVVTALRSQALLSESVGAGYLERHWPPALRDSGAWPLSGLRQSFLNGSLTWLLDVDSVLRRKIVELVESGELGLASGERAGGTYDRVWFREAIDPIEVEFDSGVFLLAKSRAKALKESPAPLPGPAPQPMPAPGPLPEPPQPSRPEPGPAPAPKPQPATARIRLSGDVPVECWNRLGYTLIPRLRSGSDLTVSVGFELTVEGGRAADLCAEIRTALSDLNLEGSIRLEVTAGGGEAGPRNGA